MIELLEQEETPVKDQRLYIEEYFDKIDKIHKRRKDIDTITQKMRNLTY